MKAYHRPFLTGIRPSPLPLETDPPSPLTPQGRNSRTTRVQEIMTHRDRMITVTPRHTILEAMNLMTRANIRHLPVRKFNRNWYSTCYITLSEKDPW